MPAQGAITKKACSIWLKWLLTRPFVFGITAYQALRLKLLLGQPLMDSAVGDELLEEFSGSEPRVSRMANLRAAVGLLQLGRIDAFNEGARRNARILTEGLGDVPGIKIPRSIKGSHIYVYYPLTVERGRRDDLRRYLLRHGIDSKISDMSDCSTLKAFRDANNVKDRKSSSSEASILEVCVYPVVPEGDIRRLARVVRAWAESPKQQTQG